MAVPFPVIALVPTKLMNKKDRETYPCDKCKQLCWIHSTQLKAKAEDNFPALCSECLAEYGVKFFPPKPEQIGKPLCFQGGIWGGL